MTKVLTIFLTTALVVLAGCGASGTKDETAATTEKGNAMNHAPEAAAVPMIVDGHQVVRVIVKNTGYEPDRIALHAGMPAKFIFVQEGDSECSSKVQMPELGVGVTELPEGEETVIAFTPDKAGTFTFTCGMEMLSGTIVVAL